MNWSWSSFSVTLAIFAVILMPRRGYVPLKATLAVAFLIVCEGMLIGDLDGRPLVAVQLLGTSGLLFLAELAARPDDPLVPLAWMVAGTGSLMLIAGREDELVAWIDDRRVWLAVGGFVAASILGVLAIRRQRQ